MPACPRRAVAMFTDFFAADDSDAPARRTGFVQRTSKMTGKLLLARVPFGVWSAAKTTLVPLAAQVTPWGPPVDVSPDAMHHRMHKKAIAFLQDMIRQALANVQSRAHVCDEGLFPACTNVDSADSTGCELPEELHQTFPGAGGSAATAGAKIQAVWDYQSRVLGQLALTPWNLPEQRYLDPVVALAYTGVLVSCDLGDFQVNAWASLATAGAYVFCRLHHQTPLYETVAGRLCPVTRAGFLTTVAPAIPRREQAISIGANACVAARLMAVRMPEASVNARRSIARKNAKKNGSTPSPSHLELLAWNLFMTKVPYTIWKTETVVNV
jgi:hypothetical protein